MRILITRPEEDGAEFAEAIRAAGHEPVLCPLLEIVFPETPPLRLDGVAALIVTSRNGLRGLARNPVCAHPVEGAAIWRLPVFCVGEATARMARGMGFTRVHSGAGGARDLLAVIEAHVAPGDGALLQLGGEQLAFDLPAALTERGFEARLEALYRAEPAPGFSPGVAEAIARGEIRGAVLMSPRTARIFAKLLHAHGLVAGGSPFVCYCLSPAIAQALGTTGMFVVRVAQKPNVQDILDLVGPGTAH